LGSFGIFNWSVNIIQVGKKIHFCPKVLVTSGNILMLKHLVHFNNFILPEKFWHLTKRLKKVFVYFQTFWALWKNPDALISSGSLRFVFNVAQ
jgi:hypothetical protein